MFNGGYNPITNVLADCPQASVVLLEDGTLRISGKVVFPYEKRILRDAVEGTKIPDPVPPAEFQDVPGTDPQVAPVRMTHKLPHESHAAPPPNVVTAESARAAASSTPHAAAPARTIGRWGPHGPRWAAESAEMARFGVTGGGILEILASGAVSYLEIERRPSSTSNRAISAKLSMDRAHLVMIDL